MLNKLFGDMFGKKMESELPAPSLVQRRKAVRRSCDLEVEGWLGKKAFTARVMDIGVGGMCLCMDTPTALKQQTVVSVTYPEPLRNCETLTVETLPRWTRIRPHDGAQLIGLEFKDPKGMGRSWVKVKMRDLGFAPYNIREQRSHIRVSGGFKATVQIAGEAVPCAVKNVGLGGVYVEIPKPLRAGATVTLRVLESDDLPSGALEVTVRHQQHNDPSDPFGYGLAFTSIEPEFRTALEVFILKRQAARFEKGSDDGYPSEEAFPSEEADAPELEPDEA